MNLNSQECQYKEHVFGCCCFYPNCQKQNILRFHSENFIGENETKKKEKQTKNNYKKRENCPKRSSSKRNADDIKTYSVI